jgi:hypothetical protein
VRATAKAKKATLLLFSFSVLLAGGPAVHANYIARLNADGALDTA